MKKTILFTAFFVTCTLLQGQSYWSLSGNSASSSNFLGTTNSQALYFKTNNETRMTLSASQAYLGIGTSTPNGNLHIHSTYRDVLNYRTVFQMTNVTTGSSYNDGFRIRQSGATVYLTQLEKANLYFQNNGQGFTLDTNGYVGFNTNKPKQKIHVVDNNILISHSSVRAPGVQNGAILFGDEASPDCTHGAWGIEYVDSQDEGYGLNFFIPWSNCNTNPGNNRLFLADNGNIGIGTNNPLAKLSVDGNICAKEVRVSLSGSPCWPDYVFAQDYDLMKISDLRSYVQQNRHLPGVPSAAEVEENGVELGATTELLLQKIEEMTLYIFQLEERIQQLENGKGGVK
jgi:hypothetical protein